MDPALAALYEKVKDRLAPDEFERRVAEAREAFDGLLDDEACGLLVLDELGLNEGAYATLSDLKGRSEATVRVRIERLEPPRTFERAGRDPGRVANVVVSDATGEARLVFWDRDVEKTEDGTLRAGALVTVVNARVKEGRFGPELHIGPWSVLEVEGALDPAKRKLLADVAAEPEKELSPGLNASADASGPSAARPAVQTRLPREELPSTLEGALAWLSPTRPYRTSEGATGFACDLDLDTERGLLRVVCWNEAVKAARGLAPGARVRIGPLAPKVKGAMTEWHTTRETRFETT